jgi:hypothetical protein
MKRFLDKVEKTVSCWIWKAGKRNDYGVFRLNNKVIDAHRVSYMLFKGELSNPKLIVCHTCDNKSCVNPDHLYLGSYTDNIMDSYTRSGRNRREINIVHGTKNAYNYACRCGICTQGQKERMQAYRKKKEKL